jgi:hypothetical protein
MPCKYRSNLLSHFYEEAITLFLLCYAAASLLFYVPNKMTKKSKCERNEKQKCLIEGNGFHKVKLKAGNDRDGGFLDKSLCTKREE